MPKSKEGRPPGCPKHAQISVSTGTLDERPTSEQAHCSNNKNGRSEGRSSQEDGTTTSFFELLSLTETQLKMLEKVKALVQEYVKQRSPRTVPFWQWGGILFTPLPPQSTSDCWRPRTLHGATQATINNLASALQVSAPLEPNACATQAQVG